MKTVIGIDGGGTKTHIRMTDMDRNVICELLGGSCNIYSNDPHVAKENLKEILRQCCAYLSEGDEVEAVCIGCAGVLNEAEGIETIRNTIREVIKCSLITVVNDSVISLYANLREGSGISITAGTGSICCGKNAKTGTVCIAGGWGHLFSDEGSAFQIVVSALKQAFFVWDSTRGHNVFMQLMLNKTGCLTPEQLAIFLSSGDNKNKSDIAAFAPLVDFAAEAGDRDSLTILERAADDLLSVCNIVIGNLKLEDEPFSVILNGSVLRKSKTVRQNFTQKIQSAYSECSVENVSKDSAWGAVYLALGSAARA